MSAVLEAREPPARYLESIQPALVRQFELLATAPGGVARLRELILTLAVQGRLVPQDRSDEPAIAFVDPIRSSQPSGSSGDRARNQTPGLVSTEEDMPFDLPIGWQRARLGSIFTLQYGAALPEKTRLAGSIPVYGSNGQVGTHCEALVQEPSLVIGRKGSVGAVNVTSGSFWPIDTSYFVTPPDGVHLQFAYWLFRSLRLGKHDKATAIPGISRNDVYAELIALPPTAEQARIVARVDELMSLCDALEAQGRLEAEQHARLLGTLLGTLTDSRTPDELAANWQRVADHFDLLLDRPAAVGVLEQVILQLGLRGVLLPSPSLDESPTAHGQQRSLHDDPFAWPTVKLGDVLTDLRYGTSAKCSYAKSGTPVLRIPNLRDGAIDISDLKLGELEPKEVDNLRLEVGDLLIIRSNGSAGLVGTAALVSSPLPGFAFAGYLVRARLERAKVVPHFMALIMKSPEVRRQIEGPIRTTSGVKNINSTEIQRIAFTLPPLEKQELIVHTVTELRRLCATLHERLDRCNAVQAALAEALIDQALIA